jgi:hypothetical protein
MSVHGSRGRVQVALKDLHIAWNKVTETWNDVVSREFERNRLDPLEGKVRAAVAAMEQIGEVLARCRRECGD